MTIGPFTRFGLAVALTCAAADQAAKLWLIHVFDLPARLPPNNGRIELIRSFLDLVLTWNQGVSYGLFQQRSALGQWVLLGITAVALVLLGIWLARASSRLTALALGLIIGGAVGNAIDRLHWPGVMDFLLFYATFGGNRFEWYVFNLADATIVAGVIGLLYESLVGDRAAKAPRSGP